jgi:hypothetical protein
MTTVTGPDTARLYALGRNPDESARLRRQSDELRPQTADLLGRIRLEPGQSANDLGCDRQGADLHIGRRLAELFRQAGLEDVKVVSYAPVYPATHSRRTLLPDLVLSMRPVILELGLANERELNELDHQVREHVADPRTLTMPHLLFVVRGRKPEQQK